MERYAGTAQPGWRCNHCHGATRVKVKIRRRDRDCYLEVRAFVESLLADPEKCRYGFTKEDLAVRFKVKNHNVEQALARLNREGLVNQPVHHYPHDNNRSNQMDGGWDSSWIGDIYTVRRERTSS